MSFLPQHATTEETPDFRANRRKEVPAGTAIAAEDELVEALRSVYDPEIPVNIYDLGLIYDMDVAHDGSVKVEMTLTAPGCPVAGEMPGMVADAVIEVPGVPEVEVTLTFEPPWSPRLMSEDAKLALGMF